MASASGLEGNLEGLHVDFCFDSLSLMRDTPYSLLLSGIG